MGEYDPADPDSVVPLLEQVADLLEGDVAGTLDELRRSALEAWNMSIYSDGYTRRVLDADIAYVQALEAEVNRLHTRLFSSCCPCAICVEVEGRTQHEDEAVRAYWRDRRKQFPRKRARRMTARDVVDRLLDQRAYVPSPEHDDLRADLRDAADEITHLRAVVRFVLYESRGRYCVGLISDSIVGAQGVDPDGWAPVIKRAMEVE